jgi:exodeoxyribonuclease VII small subunit
MPPSENPTPTAKIDPKTTFESAQQELETLIEKIEGGQVGLEESMTAYERGLALLNHCRTILDQAEQKFTDLTEKAKGGAQEK